MCNCSSSLFWLKELSEAFVESRHHCNTCVVVVLGTATSMAAAHVLISGHHASGHQVSEFLQDRQRGSETKFSVKVGSLYCRGATC